MHAASGSTVAKTPASMPACTIMTRLSSSVGDGAWRGRIAPGCAADFAIVDTDVFAAEPPALLRARIVETVVAGTPRHG